MGFKHQILASREPSQLLDVTTRHLKTLKAICGAPAVDELLDSCISK
jgi:hypothetical protein